MKKILQAFDGASEKKPVAGANDMKKFLSIIKEGVAAQSTQEAVISSFEAGSIGGDANDFLLAADKIQDEVMAQVNRIKINADEALLRDMMDKFNNFMTSYHAVGKDILQPDMFNDSMGEGRHGYDDSGMSLAPGHDEGEPVYNPRYDRTGQYDRKAKYSKDYDYNTGKPLGAPQERKGFIFYNVNDPLTAKQLGLKQTKSGKWYLPTGSVFSQKQADKVFGAGKVWYPKNESIEESTEKRCMQCGMKDCKCPGDSCKCKPIAGWVPGKGFKKAMEEAKEKTMSRAAKGNEKYGKDGMKALAKAGREGASEEQLDKIRDKHDKYDEAVSEEKQKGVDGKACWDGYKRMGTKKKGGKTVDNCVKMEGLSFKDYVNLAESKKGLE